MTAFSVAQQRRATALYRSLLRTTRTVFAGDQNALTAAYQESRRRFVEGRNETNAEKIEEALTMGEQVVDLLRHNVVQGEAGSSDPSRFSMYNKLMLELRFTKDTELGSNDTIRRSKRPPSIQEIRNTQRKAPACSSAQYHSMAYAPGQARMYSSRASESKGTPSLPRPVAQFPQRVILADGSSIQLTTTSPRHLVKLTRDITNNVLWNPMMSRGSQLDTEDDTGRLGRFRRRFAEDAVAATEVEQKVSFDEGDLDWMSGGREAREGTPISTKKAKGKGRK
ncbi:hypothetical protein MYAM1_003823 [Malassezia yamatoensis]|uniref:Mitochondrial zinc maintenance protein 1, mitochondrial n=1 Tax=Malassezia yamatoensis TaxID=253288 RepID=A0AAJ5Z0N6_9BASI|nr:hypothetical protein MYAM1_003823 [Malassezia yamatoensis]